jgi:hypothetical protein
MSEITPFLGICESESSLRELLTILIINKYYVMQLTGATRQVLF